MANSTTSSSSSSTNVTCGAAVRNSTSSSPCKSEVLLTTLDLFSLANLPQKDNRLWIPYVCMVLLTLWCLYLIKVYYTKFVDLRTRYFQSPETGPGPYTVFVTDTPKLPIGSSPQEHISLYFKRLYPLQFYECQSVRDYDRLERWTKTLHESEMYLEHYEAELAWRDTRLVSDDFHRPKTRLGPWGLWGKKVDAVDWYTKAVKDGRVVVNNLRLKARTAYTSTAFITFRSRATASIAAQVSHNANELLWRTEPAPEPRDVCWENCKYRHTQRVYRRRVMPLLLIGLMIVFMIPIGFIMGLTNFRTFNAALKFINIRETTLRKGFFSGIIPAVLLVTVTRTLIPRVTRWLALQEGYISWSGIEHRAMMISFLFYNVNVMLGALTFTSLFSSLKDLIKHGISCVDQVAAAVPVTGTFFIIYLCVNTFVVLPVELVRPFTASIYFFRIKFVCRTARDFKNAWRVGTPPLVREVAPHFLFILVGILYSIVKPIIIPFLVVHFYATRLVWKNQLCHVYRRQWDSGGMLWLTFHRAVMWSLLTCHVVMMVLFKLQSEHAGVSTWRFLSFPAQVYATLPLMAFTVLWAMRIKSKWARTVNAFPLDVAMGMDGMDRHGGLDAPEPKWLRGAFVPHFMRGPQPQAPGAVAGNSSGGASWADPYYDDDATLTPLAGVQDKKKDAVFRGEVAPRRPRRLWGGDKRRGSSGSLASSAGGTSLRGSSVGDVEVGEGKEKRRKKGSMRGRGGDTSSHGDGGGAAPPHAASPAWKFARRSVRFVGSIAGTTNSAVRLMLPNGRGRPRGTVARKAKPGSRRGEEDGKASMRGGSPGGVLSGGGGVTKRKGMASLRLLRGRKKGHRGTSGPQAGSPARGALDDDVSAAPGDVSVDVVSVGDDGDDAGVTYADNLDFACEGSPTSTPGFEPFDAFERDAPRREAPSLPRVFLAAAGFQNWPWASWWGGAKDGAGGAKGAAGTAIRGGDGATSPGIHPSQLPCTKEGIGNSPDSAGANGPTHGHTNGPTHGHANGSFAGSSSCQGQALPNGFGPRSEPSLELSNEQASAAAAAAAAQGPTGGAVDASLGFMGKAAPGGSGEGSSTFSVALRDGAMNGDMSARGGGTPAMACSQPQPPPPAASLAQSLLSWLPWGRTYKHLGGRSHHEQTVLSLVLCPSFEADKKRGAVNDGATSPRGQGADSAFTFDTKADRLDASTWGGRSAFYSPAYDHSPHATASPAPMERSRRGSTGGSGHAGIVVGGGWQNNASVLRNQSGRSAGGAHLVGSGGSGIIGSGGSGGSNAGHGGGGGGGNASGVVMHPAVRWQQQVQESSMRLRSPQRAAPREREGGKINGENGHWSEGAASGVSARLRHAGSSPLSP